MAERNPFARVTRSAADLAADPFHNVELPGSVPPSEALPTEIALPPGLNERVTRRTGIATGRFQAYPFLGQAASQLLVPEQPDRFYLIVINNSAAVRLFLGFDYEPTATNGVILEINLGFYEPWVVPTNAINVAAGGANAPGICLIATRH